MLRSDEKKRSPIESFFEQIHSKKNHKEVLHILKLIVNHKDLKDYANPLLSKVKEIVNSFDYNYSKLNQVREFLTLDALQENPDLLLKIESIIFFKDAESAEANQHWLDEINTIINDENLDEESQCLQIKGIFNLQPTLNLNPIMYPVDPKLLPIHYACWQGKIEIVKLLIHHQADLNRGSRNGKPLSNALSSGNPELVRLLLSYGAQPDRNSLYFAAKYNFQMIKTLVTDYDLDPSTEQKYGITILYDLISSTYDPAVDNDPLMLETIDFLINKKVPLGKNSMESLSHAAECNFINICEKLLNAGAKVSKDTLVGMIIRTNPNIKLLNMLLQEAAEDVDTSDLLACFASHVSDRSELSVEAIRNIVTLLVRYGAKVDVLHKVDSVPNATLVQCLLDLGADRKMLLKRPVVTAEDWYRKSREIYEDIDEYFSPDPCITPEVKQLLDNYHPEPASLSQLCINTFFRSTNPDLEKNRALLPDNLTQRLPRPPSK